MESGSHTVLRSEFTESEKTSLQSISISFNGGLVAAGCQDGMIRIWDVQTGNLVERLRGPKGYVTSVAFTPDDKGIISGSDGNIKRWDLTPFLERDACAEPLSPVTSAPIPVLDPVSNVATPAREGGERGSVCTLTFDGHRSLVSSACASQDGLWVVSGSYDKSVLFWDAGNAQVQFAVHGHKNWVCPVDVSAAANIFATGDIGGIVRICKLSWALQPLFPLTFSTQGNIDARKPRHIPSDYLRPFFVDYPAIVIYTPCKCNYSLVSLHCKRPYSYNA